MNRSILMLLVAGALLPACDKNAVQEIAAPSIGARVKFFNFAPSSPAVNFYANDSKITAVSATSCAVITDANREQCTTVGSESTSGVTYGGSGHGASGWYSEIPAGQYTLSGRISAATDKDLAISGTSANLAAGQYYSFYQSGIYDAATKTADSFIVQDVLPAVDHTVAYVRFVNASSNANPMTLHATNRTSTVQSAVGGEVAYKSAGQFTALEPGAYDLATRVTGSATNVFSRTNVNFTAGRVYTITARGSITTASTMALDNTANR